MRNGFCTRGMHRSRPSLESEWTEAIPVIEDPVESPLSQTRTYITEAKSFQRRTARWLALGAVVAFVTVGISIKSAIAQNADANQTEQAAAEWKAQGDMARAELQLSYVQAQDLERDRSIGFAVLGTLMGGALVGGAVNQKRAADL